MALHYILDGYNIIKCVDFLADASLEEGRRALLRIIHQQRPQGSVKNSVTIVFHGKDDVWGHPQSDGSARVIFTSGESADDYIKHAVESSADQVNMVVVSNDKEIVCYVRKLGAQVMGVEKFLTFSGASGGNSGGKTHSRGKSKKMIGSAVELKINKEFEKIWLEKKQ